MHVGPDSWVMGEPYILGNHVMKAEHRSNTEGYSRKRTRLKPVLAMVPVAVVTWDCLLQGNATLGCHSGHNVSFDRVSYIIGCVAEDDLELLILFPPLPECWTNALSM